MFNVELNRSLFNFMFIWCGRAIYVLDFGF
jgi:hypothetical protein